MNEPNHDNNPQPKPGTIMPEQITDEMLQNCGPILFPKFENDWTAKVHRIFLESKAAAEAQDRESLLALRQIAKVEECHVSRWRERIDRAKNTVSLPAATFTSIRHFADLEETFHALADNLSAALAGELPGQEPPDDSSESWKN